MAKKKKKRKFLKDLTRVGRRINIQRRKGNSPLWRRKALTLWSFLVRALAANKCESCGVSAKEKILNAHHILPKERYQWLMFALINGVCLCQNCHKTGRHSAHLNPIWFTNWLKFYKPKKYEWAAKHCMDEICEPPNFKMAYDHLFKRVYDLGFGALLAERTKARSKSKKTGRPINANK
jgi:hypothetical protein